MNAAALLRDRRIAQAKKLLAEALSDHTKEINQIRPAIPELKQNYETLLKEFTEIRGNPLWHPYLGSGLGKGPFVELADGSIKYDFICGIGVHYLGHNHPELLNAGIDAALSNTVMQGNLQQNTDSIELSQLLTKISKLPHCFISSSGAIANENAFKIAFQKRNPASRILAFERCFTGRTLVESQISDKPGFREGLPTTISVDYVPFFDPKFPEESTKRAVETLKQHLYRYPNQHAFMCFELIQGDGGFYTAPREFFVALMTLLKENKIAVFCDEIQSFARTTSPFAFQTLQLDSFVDIVTVGKLTQVCATLFTDEYKPKAGLISQTFTASTSAIKASLVILHHLLNNDYFGPKGKIQQLHDYFTDKLQELANRHPDIVQGPFGMGSMIAFTPYGGDNKKVTDFVHRLFDAGVICFTAGGPPYLTRVRFLIPVGAITFKDIDCVIEKIEQTLMGSV